MSCARRSLAGVAELGVVFWDSSDGSLRDNDRSAAEGDEGTKGKVRVRELKEGLGGVAKVDGVGGAVAKVGSLGVVAKVRSMGAVGSAGVEGVAKVGSVKIVEAASGAELVKAGVVKFGSVGLWRQLMERN